MADRWEYFVPMENSTLAPTMPVLRHSANRVSVWLSDLDLQVRLRAHGHSSADVSLANLESDLRRRLENFDWPEIEAVRGTTSNLLHALKLCREQPVSAGRAMLLRNYPFGQNDEELLTAVVRDGLGGDPEYAHHWLLDYDMVEQRERLIRDLILPFAQRRDWKLFATLKRFELHSLLTA